MKDNDLLKKEDQTMLLRIVPVSAWETDLYRKRKPQQRFKLDLTFLVDQSDLVLINCDHNDEEISKISKLSSS